MPKCTSGFSLDYKPAHTSHKLRSHVIVIDIKVAKSDACIRPFTQIQSGDISFLATSIFNVNNIYTVLNVL